MLGPKEFEVTVAVGWRCGLMLELRNVPKGGVRRRVVPVFCSLFP